MADCIAGESGFVRVRTVNTHLLHVHSAKIKWTYLDGSVNNHGGCRFQLGRLSGSECRFRMWNETNDYGGKEEQH